jgi:hypothetical protein
MSKNKPKETIEYVIRLQDKERQMVESAIGAYQVNRIATPLVSLMSDVSGMAVLLSLLASVIGFTFIVSDDLDTAGLIDAFTTQRDQAIAAGVIISSPLGPGLGGLLSKWLGLFPEK